MNKQDIIDCLEGGGEVIIPSWSSIYVYDKDYGIKYRETDCEVYIRSSYRTLEELAYDALLEGMCTLNHNFTFPAKSIRLELTIKEQ